MCLIRENEKQSIWCTRRMFDTEKQKKIFHLMYNSRHMFDKEKRKTFYLMYNAHYLFD